MWISSDIYVNTCVRARVCRRAQYRDAKMISFKTCPRRSAAAQICARLPICARTYETHRATEIGPRQSPVLVSDDQCVRSLSLNVRETLVAIKIRTLRSRSFAISRFNPLRCRGRVDARARKCCRLILDR